MLKLTEIEKDYKAGNMTVRALKGISVTFRDSEFVSVLGPSGWARRRFSTLSADWITILRAICSLTA